MKEIYHFSRQPVKWQKVLMYKTTDEGLISSLDMKKCFQFNNNNNIKNPVNKWAADLNRQFPEEDIQKASRHMGKCSSSLLIKAMQVQNYNEIAHTCENGTPKNKSQRGCGERGTVFLLQCW